MKEKWNEMSWFRRALLVILAVMIVGFGIATIILSVQEGIEYQDTLLYFSQKGEVRRYAGWIDGKRAEFTVRPGWTVEYRWGEEVYGPYQVTEDPSASPPTDGEHYHLSSQLPGLEIRQGDEVLFRGGYWESPFHPLIREDGEWAEDMISITYGTSDGKVYDADGRELTARELHEPSLTTVAKLAIGEPHLAHQGNFVLYLMVTLLAAFTIFQISCPDLMFRWSIMWDVKDPEAAEPSDWYLFSMRAGWVVLTVVTAVLYWLALTIIN